MNLSDYPLRSSESRGRCIPRILLPAMGLLQFRLFLRELISDIVLINVADIHHRDLANIFSGHQLNISKPDIRIKPLYFGLPAKLCDSVWPCIVAGEDKQGTVHRIDVRIVEIPIGYSAEHLRRGVDIAF